MPYVDIVEQAYKTPYLYTHVEPLWTWFAALFKGDVDLFRLSTFFIIGVLLFCIIHLANINKAYFFAFFSILCLSGTLCWIRQPMACLVFLVGILLFNKNKLLSILIILSSFFIHKSSILLFSIIPFMFFPIKRKVIITYLIGIVFIYGSILMLMGFIENTLGVPIKHYLENDGQYAERHVVFTILSIFGQVLNILMILKTIYLFKDNERDKLLVRSLLGVLFISFFLMALPMDNDTTYIRMLAFGDIIMSILLSRNIQNKLFTKKYIALFFLLFICSTLGIMGTILQNYTRLDLLLKMPW